MIMMRRDAVVDRTDQFTNPETPMPWSYIRRRGPDSAELTSIPQPERYSSQDWMHNIMNLPGSQVRF